MRISGLGDEGSWVDTAELAEGVAPVFEPVSTAAPAASVDLLASAVSYEVVALPEVLPTLDEPPGASPPGIVDAPISEPVAHASAMVDELRDPDFVPENPAFAAATAGALEELVAAYNPDTATQLEPTLNHWLQVGQQQLDAGSWRTPSATADTISSAETMSAGERSRRDYYLSLGMSPAEVDAEYERMRVALARIGLDIDDVRVSASGPGKSPLDWAEESLPTMNIEGIVGTRMDSGIESLQASFADRGGGYSASTAFAPAYSSGQSLDDLIREMSREPLYSPVEVAVADLYAEYTMRDLPLYCFEYSERLRDQLIQTAPDTNPVVIEFPSAEEHGMNHYAVQIDTAEGPMVIDVTADQFALMNGNDRVGPELKTREQMEQDMLARGFQGGRLADMTPPDDDAEDEPGS